MMFELLFQLSDIPLYLCISGVFVVVSLVAVMLVKNIIPLKERYNDNAAISNTAALVSVIYAVLAGFTALYLINNNSATDDAVQRESNAAADIYRDSKWLKDPSKTDLQNLVKEYITEVINVEWPLMRHGKEIELNKGSDLIDRITDKLINYSDTKTIANSESLLLHDMLDEVRILADARQQRIHGSYSELSPELWVVILMGSIMTLGINYFFGMNFYLHLLTITCISLMVASMLFLLITVDRPFQGEFAIDPGSFQSLLKYIDHEAAKLKGT
jgi:hypothetical protein